MPSQSRLQIMQVASDIWIDLLELHYKQYKPAIARPQAPCRSKGLISERVRAAFSTRSRVSAGIDWRGSLLRT
jgi:hypothetical protein